MKEKEKAGKSKEFYTKSDLKEKGWTDSIIEKMNLEPDLLKKNPYYRNASPMKLYSIQKVKKLEETELFAELRTKSEKRKASAQKAVKTKRNKINDYIKSLTIEIPKIPLNKLVKKSIEQYNNFESYKFSNYNNYEPNFISKNSIDTEFLKRIEVNFIRHQLSDYEQRLESIFGKVGKSEAYVLLKNKILEAIAEQYPSLAEECQKQKI